MIGVESKMKWTVFSDYLGQPFIIFHVVWNEPG